MFVNIPFLFACMSRFGSALLLRFSPRLKKHPLYPLFKLIGICPKNIALYELAMRHSSRTITEKGTGVRLNNERLEFLGDSILAAAVSVQLYTRHPAWNEGEMSKRKSSIVARNVNNKVGKTLNITEYINAAQPAHTLSHDVPGNAVEALIGAIYLDLGFRQAERFVCNFIFPTYHHLEENTEHSIHNYKSDLLEWGQKHHFEVEFVPQEGEAPRRRYTFAAVVNGEVLGIGSASSKKQAHQVAAYEAIAHLNKAKESIGK